MRAALFGRPALLSLCRRVANTAARHAAAGRHHAPTSLNSTKLLATRRQRPGMDRNASTTTSARNTSFRIDPRQRWKNVSSAPAKLCSVPRTWKTRHNVALPCPQLARTTIALKSHRAGNNVTISGIRANVFRAEIRQIRNLEIGCLNDVLTAIPRAFKESITR